MGNVKVSLVKCEEYEFNQVYSAVKLSLELIGGVKKLKEHGNKVLLKPNILSGKSPEYAVTTHPIFFEAVLKVFIENDFEIKVGESPGIENIFSAAKKSGLLRVAEKYNVPFVEFNEDMRVSNPSGKIVKSFTISKEIINSDIIVSLPKLKTHAQMYYTGAMKNLFGCIPGLNKGKFHFRFPDKEKFSDMIVDLNLLLKPALGIMDGIIAMEGNGPQNGKPKKLGIIASSFDILALDVVCAELIGYNFRDIPILKAALERRHFFIHSPEDIEIVGEKFENVKAIHFERIKIPQDIHFLKNRVPEPVIKFLNRILTPYPFFNHKKCIRCEKCIEICPADALKLSKDLKIEIDYKKCIKCYCCDEVCPAGAIKLKRKLF